MDKVTFKALIMPLFELYNKEATKSMLNIYYSVLGNYEPILLESCIREAFNTCKFMPKPAEIHAIRVKLVNVNIFELIDNNEHEALETTIKLLK